MLKEIRVQGKTNRINYNRENQTYNTDKGVAKFTDIKTLKY